MPDSIENAFQKVVENAEENCGACKWPLQKERRHTCVDIIKLAAEGMLAAVAWGQDPEHYYDDTFEATIKRLLEGEEAKNGRSL